ncbi:MAG: serine/threonine-protein kinase [Polyangiaceae bacterium]
MVDILAAVSPGDVLVGKYRVERLLGQGGMGVVIEATHVALGERVAMKFLLPELAKDPEATERFLREARAAVRIKSPHVAKVSDVGTLDNGAPYMVMEFLEGQDASELLQKHGVMALPDAVDLLVQACDAIAEAHSYGIVHRDLKPANLFITRHADGSPFVKVLDFGISKVMDERQVSQLTRTTATLGSALYMSPEQIRQTRSVDHRTDIYALGVTLYELLSAAYPFDADTFPALCVEIATGTAVPLGTRRSDLPPQLLAVVERAIARDPKTRFQNVGEFCLALEPWANPGALTLIQRVARLTGALPQGEFAAGATGHHPAAPANAHASTNSQFGQASTNPTLTTRRTSPALVAALVAVPMLLLLGGGGIWLAMSRAKDSAPTATMDSATVAQPPQAPAAAPKPAPQPSAPVIEAPSPAASASTPTPVAPPKSTPRPKGMPKPAPPTPAPAPAPTPKPAPTPAPTPNPSIDLSKR